MRKDWKVWIIYINAHHLHNWSIGLDYYQEFAYIPTEVMARVFQINLLFFNITITRWENKGWI
jgi:hypothetical protein